MSILLKVGDALKCLQYVERRDGLSSIKHGDIVKVTHAYEFSFGGRQCQDLIVQHDRDLPIAVLMESERFVRI